MRLLKEIYVRKRDQNARAALRQVNGYGVKIALILEGIDDGRGNGEGRSKAIKEDAMREN